MSMKSTTVLAAACALASVIAGCPASTAIDDTGSLSDTGDRDVGVAMMDAPSMSPDVPPDAPPTIDAPADRDLDGIPDPQDCDPDVDTVGVMGERPCANLCGAGLERCSDGIWGACSAPTECLCDTPGATRVGTCGMCGMQGQRCEGGRWMATSACLGEGECVAGTSERMELPYCEVHERLCGSTCNWLPWDVVTPMGCRPDFGDCDRATEIGHYCRASDCTLQPDPCCPVFYTGCMELRR